LGAWGYIKRVLGAFGAFLLGRDVPQKKEKEKEKNN
jgi:hypothetical protein